MDEISWAEQFVPQGPPTVNDIFRRQLAPDREELESARREREEAAAREERAERMAMANRQMGDPLGNLTRSQMAAAEARDRVRALEDQLAEARQVLHRCAEQYVDWQEQAEVVQATASRSATHDLLAPAREALAAQRVERMLAEVSARPRQQAPRRPFVSRSGTAVRSEHCVWCIEQNVSDHDSYLLHSDPELNVPVTTPEQAAQWQAEHGDHARAERRGGAQAVISR